MDKSAVHCRWPEPPAVTVPPLGKGRSSALGIQQWVANTLWKTLCSLPKAVTDLRENLFICTIINPGFKLNAHHRDTCSRGRLDFLYFVELAQFIFDDVLTRASTRSTDAPGNGVMASTFRKSMRGLQSRQIYQCRKSRYHNDNDAKQ